jgi:hypothetical protein
MVDKFKQILEEVRSQKGEVTLFAILKMDEFTDKWTVIVSATWISLATKNDIFGFVRDLMINKFTPEEMATIARLGIFPQNMHIVEELLKYKEGAIINGDEKINGNIVHEAHILASSSNN